MLVHIGDRRVEVRIGQHRQQRAEDLVLHHAHRHSPTPSRASGGSRRLAASACAPDSGSMRRTAFAGIVDIGLQALVVAVIDDGRVVRRVAAEVGPALRHHGARRVDEGLLAAGRDQHIVGRDAGLPGIQQLADDDALGRLLQGVVGADDGRRLAAELQGHRRQVVRGHAHDVVADLGRAGEQQVVEGQAGEIGAHRGVAQHHR
jgi:hypothetical protein